MNEFHGATNFVFSALIKDGDLPPLRVTGDLILCEFGFDKHGGTRDVLVLLVIGVVCASLTYLFLFFSGKILLITTPIRLLRLHTRNRSFEWLIKCR